MNGVSTRAFDAYAAGGLAGSRLALTLALSLGVHAGAAMWLPAPGGPTRVTSSTTLDVRLVGAGARETLAAVQPARALPAESAPVLDTLDPPAAATVASQRVTATRPEEAATQPVAARSVATRAVATRPAPLTASTRVAAAAPAPVRATEPAATVRPSAPAPASRPRRLERAASPPPSSVAPPAPAAPAAPADPQRAAAEPAAPSPLDVATTRPPRPAAGNPAPSYPIAARRRGQEGRVLLRLEVSRDGVPSTVRVVSSSGVASLDRAARDAVSRWRFTPASRAGQAEPATVDVPVEFRLDGRG